MESTATVTAVRRATVRHAGEGPGVRPLGREILFKAVTGDTAGAWSLIEMELGPHQPGAPLHYHQIITEAFYILAGAPTFQIDGETIQAGPRSFLLAPPGVVHGFANHGPEPVRLLIVASPAGHEKFFEDIDELIRVEGQWPPADLRKLAEVGVRNDVYYLPPPAQS